MAPPSVPVAASLYKRNQLNRKAYLAEITQQRFTDGAHALAMAVNVARHDLLPLVDAFVMFWRACPAFKEALCRSAEHLRLFVECAPGDEGRPGMDLLLAIADTRLVDLVACQPSSAQIQRCLCHLLVSPTAALAQPVDLASADVIAALARVVESPSAVLNAALVPQFVARSAFAEVLAAFVHSAATSPSACVDSVARALRLAQAVCAHVKEGRDMGGGACEAGMQLYAAHLEQLCDAASALALSALGANLAADPAWALRVQYRFMQALPKHLRAGKARAAYVAEAKQRLRASEANDGASAVDTHVLPAADEDAACALHALSRARPALLERLLPHVPPRLVGAFETETRLAKRHCAVAARTPPVPAHEAGDVEVRIVQLLSVDALAAANGNFALHLEQLARNVKTLRALGDDGDGHKAAAALATAMASARLSADVRAQVFATCAVTKTGGVADLIGAPAVTECASALMTAAGSKPHADALADALAVLGAPLRRAVYWQLLRSGVRFGLEASVRALEAGVRLMLRCASDEGAGPLRYLRERVGACLLLGEDAGLGALDAFDARAPVSDYLSLAEVLALETGGAVGCFAGCAQRVGFLLSVLRERFPVHEVWSCAVHTLIAATTETDCALLCALQTLRPPEADNVFLAAWRAWAAACASTEELARGTVNALAMADVLLCAGALKQIAGSPALQETLGWPRLRPWPEAMQAVLRLHVPPPSSPSPPSPPSPPSSC